MVKTGKLLSTRPVSTPTEENPIVEARMLKVGNNSPLAFYIASVDST